MPSWAPERLALAVADVTQKPIDPARTGVGCPAVDVSVRDRRRRPGCRTAGLIRSLSAPCWGVTHHSLAARLPRPTPPTVNLWQEVSDGHARRAGGLRHRRRHASRQHSRGGDRAHGGAAGADDGRAPTRPATSGCWASRAGTRAADACGRSRSGGSFGAGLRTFLLGARRVGRRGRPPRPPGTARRRARPTRSTRSGPHARRSGRASRRATRRGEREAMRVLLITRRGAIRARTRRDRPPQGAHRDRPEQLRDQLRDRPPTSSSPLRTAAHAAVAQRPSTAPPCSRCATPPDASSRSTPRPTSSDARSTSSSRTVPELLDEPGVGPIVAAQLIVTWSHQGRVRSEAAFARLAGVAPIPAS